MQLGRMFFLFIIFNGGRSRPRQDKSKEAAKEEARTVNRDFSLTPWAWRPQVLVHVCTGLLKRYILHI